MDRDATTMTAEWEWWDGTIREGNFLCRDLNAVRLAWLEEGVVPSCNPRGINKFHSISRCVGDGVLKLKAVPQFFEDLREVMPQFSPGGWSRSAWLPCAPSNG